MDRRKFIAAVGTASTLGIAGCTGSDDTSTATATETETETEQTEETETPANGNPDYVYYPSHADKMEMLGMAKGGENGRLRVALTAVPPHKFWVVTGKRKSKAGIKDNHTMHLMVSVWDSETGRLAPTAAPSVTIYRDGEQVMSSVNPWTMLSQPMGVHFGDNLAVEGEGDYKFEVSINEATDELPSSLDSVFNGDTVTITKDGFDPVATVEDLGAMSTGDSEGKPGAIRPMTMDMMPVPQQPKFEDMPVSFSEPKMTDEVRTAVAKTDLSGTSMFDGSETVLAVSPRTRYNRYAVPLTGMKATVVRDGETIYEGDLSSAVHPDYGQFYGASVDNLSEGDEVTVSYTVPPQISRHAGYENAFFALDSQTFTL